MAAHQAPFAAEHPSLQRNVVGQDFEAHRRDALLEWMRSELTLAFDRGARVQHYRPRLVWIEDLIRCHVDAPEASELRRMVPEVNGLHTPLKLCEAFEEFDAQHAVSRRRHTPLSTDELRRIVNLAQVKALVAGGELRLVTLDGDVTLYEHGRNFGVCEVSRSIAEAIQTLLLRGVTVALVTAAGYGLDASKYRERIDLLLKALASDPALGPEEVSRFLVLGGSCHYLMRALDVAGGDHRSVVLEPVEASEWQAPELKGPRPIAWDQRDIHHVLSTGERHLRELGEEFGLKGLLIKKPRSVGLIPQQRAFRPEELDEMVLRIQEELSNSGSTQPWCVFNSGCDVWVDAGNKRVGIECLQAFLGGLPPRSCVHVGDQFLPTGNDVAARACSPCLWIDSPAETASVLHDLVGAMGWDHLSKL